MNHRIKEIGVEDLLRIDKVGEIRYVFMFLFNEMESVANTP